MDNTLYVKNRNKTNIVIIINKYIIMYEKIYRTNHSMVLFDVSVNG